VTDIDEWFAVQTEDDTRRRRWQALIALTVALALVVGAGIAVISSVGRTFAPSAPADYTGPAGELVLVQVHPGDSTTAIAASLQTAGVVKSAKAFLTVAAQDDRSRRIQPGLYQMRKHLAATDALKLLFDPKTLVGGRVTVPEGATEAKTLAIIAKSTTLSSHDIQEALRDVSSLGLPAWAKGNIEGFLYPSTYDVDEKTTVTDLLTMMVERFNEAAKRLDLQKRAKAAGLKPYEVVIIASLIQAEVKRPEDYAMVSRVIRNRLSKGMKLQLDSTVNYALKTSKLRLSEAELAVNSPYNTYRNSGLPPGPINSPDDVALEAALSPADGPWLYFVTTDPTTGETEFTDSHDEFVRLKQKFLDATR
jgi:UPF0755 protein